MDTRKNVAVFELVDVHGLLPHARAYYKLQNRPPEGWAWIVHPNGKLILWRSE